MRLLWLPIFLLLTGCPKVETPRVYSTGLYEDPIWIAQTVQDLAFDLRCDGIFDFTAGCTGTLTQQRLNKLRGVPDHVLVPLREKAFNINQNWDGQ